MWKPAYLRTFSRCLRWTTSALRLDRAAPKGYVYGMPENEQEIDYTYWQEPDGFYVGYLNIWPEHWTQGNTLAELEEMLLDLYEIYGEEEQKKTGHLKVAV
jgi:predicted RNase H-like HicB family nuclease